MIGRALLLALLGGSILVGRPARQGAVSPGIVVDPGTPDTVVLRRPVLLGYFVVTQADRDSEPDADFASALDDFDYYLGRLVRSLDSAGIDVRATSDSVITLVEPGRAARRFRVLQSDTIGVGYWVLQPGKAPIPIGEGVNLDIGLRDTVAAVLHRPDLRAPPDTSNDQQTSHQPPPASRRALPPFPPRLTTPP